MVEEELTEEQIAEFKKIDANVRKCFIDNFLNEYIAYFLYSCNKCPFLMLTDSLEQNITTGLELLSYIENEDVNINKLENILHEKYHLKITDTRHLKLKSID